MPCDGEGGDLSWDDYNDDKASTFEFEEIFVKQWLLNHHGDSEEEAKSSAPPHRLNTAKSPLNNLLYFTVSGVTSETFELDEYKDSPFMRDYHVDDFDRRFTKFDSLEEMNFKFSSIKSATCNESFKLLEIPMIKDDILSWNIDLGKLCDEYPSKREILRNCDELWSNIRFIENESLHDIQQEEGKQKIEKNQLLIIDDGALALIFEFIDTQFLIGTCSFVSSQWHETILYNTNTVNQIFMNRTLNYFKNIGNSESIRKLNDCYGLDWIETYFASGMFNFELFGEEIRNDISNLCNSSENTFFYIFLHLNPLQHLRFLPREHILIEKLSTIEPKSILIAVDCLSSVMLRYLPYVNSNCIEMKRDSDPLNFLEASLHCVDRELDEKFTLSIDFEATIPLYFEFLNSVSERISPLVKNNYYNSDWIHSCLKDMIEKAKYFMEEVLPNYTCNELLVDDDIIIGLHLILLDNFYINKRNLKKLKNFDMTELLRNRRQDRSDKIAVSTLLPSHFSQNLLDLLVMGCSTRLKYQFAAKSSYYSPIWSPEQSVKFLKEHIVELGELSQSIQQEEFKDWIFNEEIKYLAFIADCDWHRSPTKGIDLLFHYHMLHSQLFVQDSLRLTGSIKPHNFNL